jgi:methyl-accepting chemotaxis protein
MIMFDGELKAKLNALDYSQSLIEFDLDGKVVTANANFLAALGYRLEEIRG